MAAGDILSVAINADGWTADVEIEGLGSGGTYSMGLGANNDPATGTPKVVFTVVSLGFDATGAATTITRTVYGTTPVRKAYNAALSAPYPYEETEDGADVTVRLALSEKIFQKDNTGDGNSGTAPVVNILAAFYSEGGTPTNATGASFAVTNNSTEAYPKALFQWDHIAGVCAADRVAANFVMAGNARHGFGIAAVKFTATGVTSAHSQTATVTEQTATVRSATGLYACAYQTTIAVAGFTAAESIDLRAQVYPLVGDSDAVLDTNNFTTANEECLGYNKATIKYATTPKYAFVSTSGNDGTAVASTTLATAQASPFLSIGKAVQNDATVIYLLAGTHPAIRNVSSSRRTTAEWYVVQPAPGEDSSTVTVQIGTTKTYLCQRMQFRGVTLTLADTSSWLDGEDAGNALRFVNCVFDSSGVGTPTVGPSYRSIVTYFENCTGDLGYTGWYITDFSTARVAQQFDGCTFTDTNASSLAIGAWYRVEACYGNTLHAYFGQKAAGNPAPAQDNIFWDFNKFVGYAASKNVLKIGDTIAIARGASICGNLTERATTTGTNAAIWVGADSSTADVAHVIAWNNTSAGERWNFGYNDNGSTARYRKNWSVKNNIWEDIATKHDTFVTANATRIGGWEVLYGVGWSGNFSAHIDGIGADGSFYNEFIGIKSYQPQFTGGALPPAAQPPSGDVNVIGYVDFVDREAYTGSAGAGNGDYHLDTGSPALDFQREQVLPFDIEGNPRGETDSPGAFTTYEEPAETGAPQAWWAMVG